MRKYLMIAVALLLLSGCQESLEDRAAREVVGVHPKILSAETQ